MEGFHEAYTIEEIDTFIEEEKFAFVYLYKDSCSICHGVQPQAARILENYPAVQTIQVNLSTLPELAGKFTVFTVPVLLLFVEGKEMMRFARFVEMDKLNHQLARIVESY